MRPWVPAGRNLHPASILLVVASYVVTLRSVAVRGVVDEKERSAAPPVESFVLDPASFHGLARTALGHRNLTNARVPWISAKRPSCVPDIEARGDAVVKNVFLAIHVVAA